MNSAKPQEAKQDSNQAQLLKSTVDTSIVDTLAPVAQKNTFRFADIDADTITQVHDTSISRY